MNQEEAFIQQIQKEPDNPDHRLVYADYLEDQGDDRASFLRLEAQRMQSPSEKEKKTLTKQMDKLRDDLDPEWLAMLDCAAIELCLRHGGLHFELACPQQWERLELTSVATVRHCTVCQREVHHCGSIEEARAHARNRQCVVIDSRLAPPHPSLQPLSMMVAGMLVGWEDYPSQGFKRGRKVRILQGRFQGLEGTIRDLHVEDTTVTVALQKGGREAIIEIDIKDLEPMAE